MLVLPSLWLQFDVTSLKKVSMPSDQPGKKREYMPVLCLCFMGLALLKCHKKYTSKHTSLFRFFFLKEEKKGKTRDAWTLRMKERILFSFSFCFVLPYGVHV